MLDLTSKGLLDDADLARRLVAKAQNAHRGGKGVYALLRSRGIDREVAEEAMASSFDLEREVEDAARLIAMRLGNALPETRREDLEKAAGQLARRGFTPGSISRAMDRFRE